MHELYYKAITGYRTDDCIEIDTIEDLEKAVYAFMTRKPTRIGGELISGAEIKHIKPDYNRMMGYAKGYTLQADDWTEINQTGIVNQSRDLLIQVGDKVKELMVMKMDKFIGVDRRELPEFKELIQLQ